MNLKNRIFITLLSVALLLGAFSGLTLPTAAATAEETAMENIYLKTEYLNPEDRVYGEGSNMKLMLESNGYELWIDNKSGEVAMVDQATGQILLSNPYDVANSQGSDSTKMELMSQLIVHYTDNGGKRYLNSFKEAALRDQIKVYKIKSGVRVEYTIGREESRRLVPRWISDKNFQALLITPLEKAVEEGLLDPYSLRQFKAFYLEQNLDKQASQKAKERLLRQYPICAEFPIWTFQEDSTDREINLVESIIKNNCEDYTFEQMDADHEETGYVAEDEQYPVFKTAIEYSLDENGLVARVPCNGFRYDMSTYTLENFQVLPYMGAGEDANTGYNFFPDGSGALFDYQQLNTSASTEVKGQVYGIDFAYHQISGVTYQKTIRYPVYGTVTNETYYEFSYTVLNETLNINETFTTSVSSTVVSGADSIVSGNEVRDYVEAYVAAKGGSLSSDIEEKPVDRGYVAIIEEGESLAEISTYHAGSLSDYHSIKTYFNPKPKDSYDISDAISVTSSSTWTVVSDRKYTGNISIRYQMLTDETLGSEAKKADPSYTYYETSWLGMAEAYRDYLVDTGVFQKGGLTADQLEDNIPLYLETFGAIETQQTILTIPVNVMTPLTSFENILEMYKVLSDNGVKNINFKMTGYANGGMDYTVPSSLKWENAVGGKEGFKELIAEANKINETAGEHIGLYPDFDFAYIQRNELFDSTSLKDDAVKTVDNRYSSYRQYSATYQSYVSFYQLAISPSRYSKFYNKLLSNYEQYGLKSMSIASLGTALNSDFDEDDPYNREDGKDFTAQAFADLEKAGYSLMTDGSNAYTWAYVDHILNVDLDSSRYSKSSASVPFMGAVLHGYVQFAGAPFNEEGDTSYAFLRAIENGAGLYFIVSYQNTSELKEDEQLSQYYSVRYDIWEEDIISYYKQLNDLLKDVQDKVIIEHEFLNKDVERVLDLDELQAEIQETLERAEEAAKKEQDDLETSKQMEIAEAWSFVSNANSNIEKLIKEIETICTDEIVAPLAYIGSYRNQLKNQIIKDTSSGGLADLINSDKTLSKTATQEKLQEVYDLLANAKTYTASIMIAFDKLDAKKEEALALYDQIDAAIELISETDALSAEAKEKMVAEMENYRDEADALWTRVEVALRLAGTREETTNTAITRALAILDGLVIAGNYAEADEPFQAVIKPHRYTTEDIYQLAERLREEAGIEEEEETEEDTDTQYAMTQNQIVVVTYGDRDPDTHEKTAYKSFILNYNNFTVKVVYDGVAYTIPSGGYVVIQH